MSHILRTNPVSTQTDYARTVAMDNIAVFCVFADHDFKTEIIPEAQQGGPQRFEEYLDNIKLYGPAVKLFSKYLGVEGFSLRKFITEEQQIN